MQKEKQDANGNKTPLDNYYKMEKPIGLSGLKEALLALKDLEGIAQVYLDDKDVIRHRLVRKIISAYKGIETE